MELKYVELQQGADVRSSSNCTFMELKLNKDKTITYHNMF